MPSPFPGMNPYLEQPGLWRDFHLLYLAELRRALVPVLAAHYIVRVEEDLFIHEASADERRLAARADVSIAGRARPEVPAARASAATTTRAPTFATLPVSLDVEKHRRLEVRDRDGGRIVTVVELLSPSNKDRDKHRDQYEAKRLLLIQSGTNFVEVDLLRGGGRMPMDGLPPCDYCVMVSRPEEWPRAGVWPLGLRDPLPAVPIPMRPPDPDVAIDLQAALHRVYDDAGYATQIYTHAPEPPLAAADEAWARQVIAAARTGG
jgi:hypothetical protein